MSARDKWLLKLVPIILSSLAVMILLMFLGSYMYTRFGSFTVTVAKSDQINYGIALSETKDFANPTASLNTKASEEITNISGQVFNDIDLGAVDGNDNGKNYICYTFYVKNTGEGTIDYNEQIVIKSMTLGIEDAVRIRLITKYNDEDVVSVDYAKVASVENGVPIPEPNTTPFYLQNVVYYNDVTYFQPGDIKKFTIVIWLEGDDPQCIDDIIGGEFKIDMVFNVLGLSEV